ncbi:MAG TPA: endonuclease/exonuclease/phosphatase family protein [Pyrinomonadaceae bacterium]|nr:endonuclease/exonuclease/phosphatase family protein [Pyrinomonadaceae bacterium]
MSLKLLSYNIQHGGAGRETRLASVIRECEPDLVVLQEATRPAAVERIAKETGLEFWASRERESVGFVGRVRVERHAWHPLIRPGRGFMEIVLAEGRGRVYGVHLSAVHSNWTERRRRRELDLMLKAVANDKDDFHVFVGDFNTLAPGEMLDVRKLPPRLRALIWLSGGRVRYATIQTMLDASKLPPRRRALIWLSGGRVRYATIQTMLDAGYVDGYRALNIADAGHTFPVWDPHVRLDFAFLPERFAERLEACRVITEGPEVRAASDHFPLLAELTI